MDRGGVELPKFERLPSLKERAYVALKDAIISGTYDAGEALSGEDLAAEFGISKTPVREALLRLEQEGLVETVPYKGTYVRSISAEEIAEVYLVRQVLEPLAVKLATPLIPDDELKAFQSLLCSIDEEIVRGEFDHHLKADTALHQLILRNCGNATLEDFATLLLDRSYRIRLFSKTAPGDHIMRSHAEHCQIVDALLERDASKAECLMAKHISDAAGRIASLLPS